MNRPDVFLIDATFLLEASEEMFRGVLLFVNSKGEDNTFVSGFLRDLLGLLGAYRIEKPAAAS